MSDLPEPLTPAECDLRGFDWMALLGARLFKSTFYRKARKDPRGGIAGIKLWWEAMLQTPAGSLPNDEEDLCMLADFGEDMTAWRKHRAVAMHGWILCSDGRLYHSVVAEQANAAWGQRQKAKGKRETDAERLRRWRETKNGHPPPDRPNGETHRETQSETRFNQRYETHHETPKETRDETRTKHGRNSLDRDRDSTENKVVDISSRREKEISTTASKTETKTETHNETRFTTDADTRFGSLTGQRDPLATKPDRTSPPEPNWAEEDEKAYQSRDEQLERLAALLAEKRA